MHMTLEYITRQMKRFGHAIPIFLCLVPLFLHSLLERHVVKLTAENDVIVSFHCGVLDGDIKHNLVSITDTLAGFRPPYPRLILLGKLICVHLLLVLSW